MSTRAQFTRMVGQNKSCADGVCQDAACVPDCGGVTCGPDPVCGTSCGVCPPVQGPVLTVELSWTPTTEDLDLYVSRAPAATTMCDADTCDFSTCRAGNAARPDWDGNGTASDGDPVLDVADVSHDNPERVLVTIPDGAARSFRVGADNFGGVDGGTATSATATIRVKLDGVVIATHARSVASGAQWRGVVLSWNGATLASDDDGSVDSPFSCTAAAPSCTSDADCADHQACVGDFFGFNGTCQAVQCKANADCVGNANGSQCSGGHNCVAAGSTKGWKQQCANADECSVGFHCDALLNTCEEACSPTQCSAPSTPGCCTVTGGDHCTADTLFGISGNCAP